MRLIDNAYKKGRLDEIFLILKIIENEKYKCTNCQFCKYLNKILKVRLKDFNRNNIKEKVRTNTIKRPKEKSK